LKSKINLIFIGGPTGSGKTDIAIELAKSLNTEIISADSRQIYKGMEIGTAQPISDQLKEVKHHHIAILNPNEIFSAGEFVKSAMNIVESNILAGKKFLIICGGTGFYMNALANGIDEIPKINNDLRFEIQQEFESKDLEWLQNEVKKIDENYFLSIDNNNPVRLLRALEVYRSTGKSISNFQSGIKQERNFISFFFKIDPPREELYNRINARVDRMIQNGWMEEVKSLEPYFQSPSLNTIGYKEWIEYLGNPISENGGLPKVIDRIKQKTRNYAKRQVTWFNNQGTWQKISSSQEILNHLQETKND
jgi:tRNA dimethylallyltransferase